jgi:hypothetical protein
MNTVIEHDLAEDFAASPELVAKVKASETYAQNLYAALCNMQWQKSEAWPVLKDELWACTWRSAGGIVAELRGEGDYMNWYCSGMNGFRFSYDDESDKTGFVSESTVTDEIREDLGKLGWHPVPYEDD